MSRVMKYLGMLILMLCSFTATYAGASFSLGTNDFYLSVGDYDYLPYSPEYYPTRVNFHDAMGEYGTWISVAPFGRCWRPYVESSWRPYVNGHWVYTQYGPYWQGYEPWAWVGYHYGNWIYSQAHGWVWIPGYDWHPGRVAWARSDDTIGWSPAPPYGYDYSRGYLSYRGPVNQYSYYDPHFDSFAYGNGGPCVDPRYGSLYCNSGYRNVNVNLWIFIDRGRFGFDNYSDFYLGRDYVRNIFDRRLVRIHARPVRREVLERVVRQRVREVPVRTRELITEKRRVKVVVPVGQEERIRRNANRTIREVIAPAFAERHKPFKGLKSKNEKVIAALFRQKNRKPRVETLAVDQVIRSAKENRDRNEKTRTEFVKEKNAKLTKIADEIRANEKKKEQQKRSTKQEFRKQDRVESAKREASNINNTRRDESLRKVAGKNYNRKPSFNELTKRNVERLQQEKRTISTSVRSQPVERKASRTVIHHAEHQTSHIVQKQPHNSEKVAIQEHHKMISSNGERHLSADRSKSQEAVNHRKPRQKSHKKHQMKPTSNH